MNLRSVCPHTLTIALFLTPAVSAAEEDQREAAALFQASLFAPRTQLVSEQRDVAGLRLTAVYGTNADVSGLDLGLGVTEARNFSGVQITGIKNVVERDMLGLQVGVLANGVRQDATGIQIAGLGNGAQRDMTGIQIGGLGNEVGRKMVGIQIAYFVNMVGLSFTGKSVVPSKSESPSFVGIQIAVFGNYGGDRMKGVQISLLNDAVNCSGLQIGIYNHCEDMYGVQIGVWNQIDKSPVRVLPLVNAKF